MSEELIPRNCLNCIRIMCEDLQARQSPLYTCAKHIFEHEVMVNKFKEEK